MFFIVGRGRSGTTLLSTYLNALPGVLIAPECMFVMNLRRAYGPGQFTPTRVREFCKDVFLEKRIRNWSFDLRGLTEFMLARHDQAGIVSYAEACKLVYVAQAQFSGVNAPLMVGDKNPHYSLFIPELARLFPDAPFIHVVRDPRANAVSYRRVAFDYQSPAILAERWNIYNESILKQTEVLGPRYYRIRFEDFVSAPDTHLQSIADFLGLSSKGQGDRQVAPHIAQKPWHPRLGNLLDPRVIDEWRDQLQPEHARIIEHVCNNLMTRFAYAHDHGHKPRTPALLRSLTIARLTVAAEKLLFALPLRLRSAIITIYRKLTSTL